ncbi:MAG: glycosyltransferase family 2 protein [Rikenellaceae bacterium]
MATSGLRSCAVVVLNWNGEGHLRRFLPSVVEHTPEWIEIVVADNGSTDDSRGVVDGAFGGRVKWLDLGRNWGFAEGYNRALGLLSHDLFILLNSDVEVTAGWCEPLVEELTADGDVAVAGSKLLQCEQRNMFEYAGAAGGFIDYLGYPFCRGRVLSTLEEDRGQYDDARDIFWVSGAAFGCRGDVFKSLGGFDADFFAHMEEIDFCWRVQLAGYKVRVVPQSVVYHLGGGTLSADSPRKTMLNHRNNLAMIFKCAPTTQRLTCAVVRPLLDALAAASYLLRGRWRSSLAVAEAWWHFVGWHTSLSRKRKVIRSKKIAESTHIYRGSILLSHLFRGKNVGGVKDRALR